MDIKFFTNWFTNSNTSQLKVHHLKFHICSARWTNSFKKVNDSKGIIFLLDLKILLTTAKILISSHTKFGHLKQVPLIASRWYNCNIESIFLTFWIPSTQFTSDGRCNHSEGTNSVNLFKQSPTNWNLVCLLQI